MFSIIVTRFQKTNILGKGVKLYSDSLYFLGTIIFSKNEVLSSNAQATAALYLGREKLAIFTIGRWMFTEYYVTRADPSDTVI